MKNLLTPSRTFAAVLLMVGWTCVQAQSLGTPVADVLLGRPLDMSLPARFSSSEGGDECAQADVFYGERRLKAADVRTSITGAPDQRRIRVEASLPIDEPVVTVSVRAGCRATVTRNYTLLPEYPSERLLAALDARAALAAAAAAPVAPLKLAKAPTATTAGPRKAAPARSVVAQAATEATPAPRVRSARAARRSVVATGPRLKLEPFDMPEQQALLRVSNSLAEPAGDASRRATAALLWQAINADPQEVLRTTVMLQKLEQDLVQLRQSTGQTRAEMAALKARLDQAQPWYLAPGFVQVLLLLLVAAAAGAGVLWYRTRRLGEMAANWYLPAEPGLQEPVATPEPQAAPAAAPVVAMPVVAPVEEPGAPSPVVAPVPLPQPVIAAAPASAATGPIDFEVPVLAGRVQPTPVQPAPDGNARIEALAATFGEMDFLSSLGLLTDAMDIVKAYLQDSARPAPLGYLALMQLCEQAGDAAAVAAVRRRYAQAFRVEAPRLAQIVAEGGLDTLPELSRRVTSAWHGPQALAALESALFSVPTPAAPMTLQAGRDLLALYELALAEAAEGAGAQGGLAADAHALAPWAHAEGAPEAHAVAHEVAEPEGGAHFALDLDLNAAAAREPVQAPTLELAPMLEKIQADSAREVARLAQEEQEDAFSAAVASERIPVSRY